MTRITQGSGRPTLGTYIYALFLATYETSREEAKMHDGDRYVSRRGFVRSVCPLVVGGLSIPRAAGTSVQQGQPGFWSEFSASEQQSIGTSEMAQDVANYLNQGLGCAEICLATACEYLGEPQGWVNAATVFSGGFGKGDLCGLLTGGLMAIGIAAGRLHEDRAAMKQFARPLKDEYWSWWTARGPLHCSELRTRYDGNDEFIRMTQRAVAKIEELIRPAR